VLYSPQERGHSTHEFESILSVQFIFPYLFLFLYLYVNYRNAHFCPLVSSLIHCSSLIRETAVVYFIVDKEIVNKSR